MGSLCSYIVLFRVGVFVMVRWLSFLCAFRFSFVM